MRISNKVNPMKTIKLLAWASCAFAVVGCNLGAQDEFDTAARPIPVVEVPPVATDAGVPISVSADPEQLVTAIAQKRNFGSRTDPFALLGSERAFDQQQIGARMWADGGFSMFYEPEDPSLIEPTIVEPEPLWRLSAVMVGEGVSAILVMQEPVGTLIRPGQRIEGTDWRVHSIDNDRAVLRRTGNVLPREVHVRLMSALPGTQPAMGGGMAPPGAGGLPGGVGWPGMPPQGGGAGQGAAGIGMGPGGPGDFAP